MNSGNYIMSLLAWFVLISTYFSLCLAKHHSRHKRQHQHTDQSSYTPTSFIIDGRGGPEHGEWGPWSDPSECSRTCGGGVAFQTRACRDISPGSSQKCTGGTKRYFSCNIQDCKNSTADFRAEQCAEFNRVPFDEQYHDWIPYTHTGIKKCQLNCMPRGKYFYQLLKEKVIDGTRCHNEKLDICVDGQCLPVGCDGLLGSDVLEDNCRVCGGDGSGCRTRSGKIIDLNPELRYKRILILPVGANHINITEIAPTKNHLAIRSQSGHQNLNDKGKVDFPGLYTISGTIFHYEQAPRESLYALGPISEPLEIFIWQLEPTPGLIYKFRERGLKHDVFKHYKWVHGAFGGCNVSCGGGVQESNDQCQRRKDSVQVADKLCDPKNKPLPKIQACASVPCPPRWATSAWGPCSESCKKGIQERQVYCEQVMANGLPSVANENLCAGLGIKPQSTQDCNENVVCPHIGPSGASSTLLDRTPDTSTTSMIVTEGSRAIESDTNDMKSTTSRASASEGVSDADNSTSDYSSTTELSATNETVLCALHFLPGECYNYTVSWFYDSISKNCKPFNYSGCGGNMHNFPDEHASCRMLCDPSYHPEERIVACKLKLDKGSGKDFAVQWFFDAEYGECSRFWYNGRDGNANRFETLKECRQVCVSPIGKARCLLPKIKGPCGGYYRRWYYDPERGQCSQFTYNGCFGNDNNFETREDCERDCAAARPKTNETMDWQLDTLPLETNLSGAYNKRNVTARINKTVESYTSHKEFDLSGINIHPNCTDNSFFADCELTVNGKYCGHSYYAEFCCKSCTLAGQLPLIGAHLNFTGTTDKVMELSALPEEVDQSGVNIHPNCTDARFANCKLKVDRKYCQNSYYAKFCCKSCTLAGQLPLIGAHLNFTGTTDKMMELSALPVGVDQSRVNIHPNCTDNVRYANCKLIVNSKYCQNSYYAKFCCKSCTLAGQLPSVG